MHTFVFDLWVRFFNKQQLNKRITSQINWHLINKFYLSEHAKPKAEEANDTPPTSKLVTKLFPKLKTQQEKQQQEDQSKIQTASQAGVGDGIHSKALRDKLIELEREIEKFRNENSHLAKLRSEREEV